MSDLKPCPFCGEPGKIEYYGFFTSNFLWSVGCTSILCIFATTTRYSTKEDAIRAWNTRAVSTPDWHYLADEGCPMPGEGQTIWNVIKFGRENVELVRDAFNPVLGFGPYSYAWAPRDPDPVAPPLPDERGK